MGYLGTMPKALADIISAPGTPLRTHEQMLRSLCLLWIKEKGNLSRCVCWSGDRCQEGSKLPNSALPPIHDAAPQILTPA